MTFRNSLIACSSSWVLALVATPAFAQADTSSSPTAGSSGEIIVTANKREQSINDVGLTIQAASAEALENRGISEVADLGKLVAGFVATQSTFATPASASMTLQSALRRRSRSMLTRYPATSR